MAEAGPRTPKQRKSDALAMLRARQADLWVASASGSGVAHLVPLSLAWDGERVVVAMDRRSPTARNIISSGTARLAVGPTRDVVMIDATLDAVMELETAPDRAAAYADQAGWDPRTAGENYVLLALRPERVQAWREADEIAGRTLMRDGIWLV